MNACRTWLVFDNGVTANDPTPDDLINAVASIKDKPGLGLIAGRDDVGCRLRMKVNSPGSFYLELFSERQGVRLECSRKNLPVQAAVLALSAIVQGDMEHVESLGWQEHVLAATQAFQCGDRVYYPKSDGSMGSMTMAEAMTSMSKTRRNELIVWSAALGLAALLSWAAISAPAGYVMEFSVLFGALGLMAGCLHVLNWRCPACGNSLGPVPPRRCRCSWHGQPVPKRGAVSSGPPNRQG